MVKLQASNYNYVEPETAWIKAIKLSSRYILKRPTNEKMKQKKLH